MSNGNGHENGFGEILRRFAALEPTQVPMLTAYLDMRPHMVGDPTVRAGQVVLRDRLREIQRPLKEHSPESQSLQGDAELIEARIAEALPDVQGLAVVSCSAAGVFEALELPVAPGSAVTFAPLPDLVPLARFADQEAALVILYDTNTLRLFLLQAGGLKELPGHDAPPDEFGKHLANAGVLGGRVDERRAQFAREAADVIDRTMTQHAPAWLIASEDDVALPILREKLSKKASDLLRATVRLDIRASYDDILALTAPIAEHLRADDAQTSADALVDEVGEQDLGIAGVDATRQALERGQGLELLIDESVQLAEAELTSLVRLAASTHTRTRFVQGHEGLTALGGVGALLRFKIETVEEAEAAAAEAGNDLLPGMDIEPKTEAAAAAATDR